MRIAWYTARATWRSCWRIALAVALIGGLLGGVALGAGALFGSREDPIAVTAFTVTGGRISAIDLISDPDKLQTLALSRGGREPSQAD